MKDFAIIAGASLLAFVTFVLGFLRGYRAGRDGQIRRCEQAFRLGRQHEREVTERERADGWEGIR